MDMESIAPFMSSQAKRHGTLCEVATCNCIGYEVDISHGFDQPSPRLQRYSDG